jgi:hypothetical protein
MKSFHFETPQHKALECEILVKSLQKLEHKENLDGTKRFRCLKLLFVGAKTFMKVATIEDAFLIYVLPSLDVEPHPHEIPSQYQEFKDVFEKRNVDTLPKH